MLPIELETKKSEIKFLGLALVEDPENRPCLFEGDCASLRRISDFGSQHVPAFATKLCRYDFERLTMRDRNLLPLKSGLEDFLLCVVPSFCHSERSEESRILGSL